MKTTHPLSIKIYLGMCLMFIANSQLSAATVYSSIAPSGNWSSATTWMATGTGSPVFYRINPGHTVNLDVDAWNIDTLYIQGTLKFNANKYLYMNKTGAIILNNTGVIKGGSGHSGIWFDTACTIFIQGAFNGKSLIDGGPRYADYNTTIFAGGEPQGSFPIILPVEISSSEVRKIDDHYSLFFTANGESNQHWFRISIAGSDYHFREYTVVEGKTELQSADYEVNLGKQTESFYVRITELSATFNEDIVTKYVKVSQDPGNGFKLFPTVIDGDESITLVLPEAGEYQFRIYSTSLQECVRMEIHTETDNSASSIPTDNIRFKKGIYYAVVTGANGESFRSKLGIQ